jgi:hypothetical protein
MDGPTCPMKRRCTRQQQQQKKNFNKRRRKTFPPVLSVNSFVSSHPSTKVYLNEEKTTKVGFLWHRLLGKENKEQAGVI